MPLNTNPSKNKALLSGLAIGGVVACVFGLTVSLENSSEPQQQLSAVELAKQADVPRHSRNLMGKEAALIGITKKVTKKPTSVKQAPKSTKRNHWCAPQLLP